MYRLPWCHLKQKTILAINYGLNAIHLGEFIATPPGFTLQHFIVFNSDNYSSIMSCKVRARYAIVSIPDSFVIRHTVQMSALLTRQEIEAFVKFEVLKRCEMPDAQRMISGDEALWCHDYRQIISHAVEEHVIVHIAITPHWMIKQCLTLLAKLRLNCHVIEPSTEAIVRVKTQYDRLSEHSNSNLLSMLLQHPDYPLRIDPQVNSNDMRVKCDELLTVYGLALRMR